MATKTILVDMNRPILDRLLAVQGESSGRTLAVKLYAGSLPIDITGATVTLYATKPDATIIFNNFTVTDADAGEAYIALTSQFCAVAGTCSCEIRVTFSGGAVMKSKSFEVEVVAAADYTAAVESTSEYTALDTALGIVSGHEARITSLETDVGDLLYTENNYIVDSEPLTDSVDKLDMRAKDNADAIALKMNLAGGSSNPFTAVPYVGADPIVESGSNANGTYTKFSSGLMICRQTTSSMTATTASGNVFTSAATTWTFPVAFTDTPSVEGGFNIATSWLTRTNYSTTTVDIYRMSSVSSASALAARVTAIGRWK